MEGNETIKIKMRIVEKKVHGVHCNSDRTLILASALDDGSFTLNSSCP